MKAEIVSIGSELLEGQITDTNATFLAQELLGLGIAVGRVTGVGDSLHDIRDVLASALERADLVVCTGGIGPTPDDLTREAIADLLREQMTLDPVLERDLRSYFSGRGRQMPEQNLKQATLIPSAQPLRNRSGTAPGWWVETNGRVIVTMPGVPREMRTIWREEVLPRLEGRSEEVIRTATLKTYGLGESSVAQDLGGLWLRPNPSVATYAKSDGVHVVVRSRGTNEAEVERSLGETVEEVRRILGDAIWGEGEATLPEVITDKLETAGATISTWEDTTGGALAAALAATASPSFVGGSVLHQATPRADYTVSVGAPSSNGEGPGAFSCEVELYEGGRRVASATSTAHSDEALRERTVYRVLHLLYEHLARNPQV